MRTKEPTKIGLVQEVLRGDFYRVSIGEQEARCYRSGKMRMNKIGVNPGDRVECIVEGNIGRIIRRY